MMFEDKRLVPGRADNFKEAVELFLEFAVDIADGLSYIHEIGLVHRHLKLENVLVGNRFKNILD